MPVEPSAQPLAAQIDALAKHMDQSVWGEARKSGGRREAACNYPGYWLGYRRLAEVALAWTGAPLPAEIRRLVLEAGPHKGCDSFGEEFVYIADLLRALQAQPSRHDARDGASPQNNGASQ